MGNSWGVGGSPQTLWNGNSWGGGGCKTKSLPWGGYGYFLELHNLIRKQSTYKTETDNAVGQKCEIFLSLLFSSRQVQQP